ncbi:IS5 family transposase [Streptomyces lydicus]|uniref:IS5 family transposase n=1 Tax=Streptomyces lydicus TaxID=47763 RepID=UPI0037A73FF9
MGRGDLSDAEWARLKPHLPKSVGRDGRWKSHRKVINGIHRRVINGILFRQRSSIPWRDLPTRFGRWKTLYARHRRWSADGTWGENPAGRPGRRRRGGPDRLEHGQCGLDLLPGPSACRGARTRAPRIPRRRGRPVQYRGDEASGRSRGGLTCKIHLASEGGRRPLAFVITPGQWGDVPQLTPVLERICVPRPSGGHPRTRPDHMSGDKAYSSRRNRRYLRRRRIKHPVPERKDQRADRRRRASTGGRPTGFASTMYPLMTRRTVPSRAR